ncbi:hypothetical protein ACHAW5_003579 [Stephanodiscus triporus]|uniref:Helicase-associated domain-containing protein n=1 Tax=Stephanodiscus triporus TaxID=2934178 RepID=A0ABD3PIT1_9STRA
MSLISRSFRPLRGALRSFLKPITSAASIRIGLTKASISSTGYKNSHNTRRFLSLVGAGGIRCLNSSAADEIDEFSPCSDATDEHNDDTVDASRRKTRWDRMWNRRYEELKEYVAEHGDSLVPWKYAKNESLGVWVKRQRSHFNSSKFALSNERIKKLDEIGFIWDVHEAQWFERLQELKEYKKNHGDTLVPRDNREYPLLGRWVNTQRSDYTRYQKIKELEEKWRGVEVLDDKVKEEMDRLTRRSTGMTENRIQLLEAEGFVWDVHEAHWFERLQELKEYKKNHGDTLVPRDYCEHSLLARWVNTQRVDYTRYQKIKELEENWRGVEVLDDKVKEEMDRLNRCLRGMTEKRIQLLEAEGFVWDAHEAHWFERLQELKDYKRNHGDTLVPFSYSANPLLGRWVSNQRTDYSLYLKKKEFEEKWRGVEVLDDKVKEEMDRLTTRGMTEKRIQLLEAEGFVWDVHAHAWELRFQELRTLVALDGRAVFIQRPKGCTHDRYDPLAAWASMQRENFMKRQNGLHTTLTEDRIEKLNSIGFAWEIPKKRVRRISMKRQHFI